jgi:pyrimidine operon attenuation protein/uracil phosphoribosyltransferase
MNLPEPNLLIDKIFEKISSKIDQDTCIIGIPSGGSLIVDELKKKIQEPINYGLIDASFYRDDLEISGIKLKQKTTSINFDVDKKKIILIDDVFFTGRTIRAAINEIFDFGRPKEIQLYVLIDRKGNELPIQPNYSGIEIDIPKNIFISLDKEDGNLIFNTTKIDDKPKNK